MKRLWNGYLKHFSWTRARGGKPMDHLVLTVELDREPGRQVEVLVPKEQAIQMCNWIKKHITPDPE